MPYSARLRTALHVTHRSRLHRRLPELDTGLDSYPKRGKNLHNEKMCCFGNGDPVGQGPWMAMWVVQAHREKQIGHCRWENGPISEPPTETELTARACHYHCPEICYEFDMQKKPSIPL